MTAIKCTEDVLAAAEVNNNFMLEFHGKIRKDEKNNTFYCGITTTSLLSMMWSSLKDNRTGEARKLLKFLKKDADESIKEKLDSGFSQIMRAYKNLHPGAHDATLTMVNKLYTRSGFGAVTDDFKSLLNEYNCHHESIQVENIENIIDKINEDFAGYTNDRVRDVASHDTILPGACDLMLVSSFSFRGVWEVPFDETKTEVMAFNCLNGRKVQVNMMKKRRAPGFSYTNFANAQAHACALYFEGFRYCMIVVRPRTRESYRNTETQMMKELNPDVLIAHFKRYHRKSRRGDGGLLVNLQMPRFRIQSRHLMNAHVNKMTDIIGSGVDKPKFGDIFVSQDGRHSQITQVIQKCEIQIDETGAPQGLAVPPMLPARPLWKARPKCVKMILDRVFYFVLYDYTNNCLLAAGIVDDPTQS